MACGCSLLAYVGIWQVLIGAPRTVAFNIEGWTNNSWGLHNIVRGQISGTVAVSGDGSRANNIRATHYNHYLISSGERIAHSIYLRPANVAYEIDDKTKTTTLWHCTCTWEEPSPQLPDEECRAVAHATLGDSTRIGVDVVAGTPVVRYRIADSKEVHEAAFAQRFGCDLFEERSATYNVMGIPTSRFHFVVRSYLPGEPNEQALHPPAGYAVREKRL